MGLFVKRVAPESDVAAAVTSMLRADPSEAADPGKVAGYVAAAKDAAKGTTTLLWVRVLVGVLIGAALIAAGVALTIYGDNWAAEQALKAATTPDYVAPTSSVPAVATSIIALGSAWSGALVGVVLSEKASA